MGALFSLPTGLSRSDDGTLWVADQHNAVIRKLNVCPWKEAAASVATAAGDEVQA